MIPARGAERGRKPGAVSSCSVRDPELVVHTSQPSNAGLSCLILAKGSEAQGGEMLLVTVSLQGFEPRSVAAIPK